MLLAKGGGGEGMKFSIQDAANSIGAGRTSYGSVGANSYNGSAAPSAERAVLRYIYVDLFSHEFRSLLIYIGLF